MKNNRDKSVIASSKLTHRKTGVKYLLTPFIPLSIITLTACQDQDGDGYTTEQGDCDDRNAEINPGAEEVSGDGVDNNCNGKIDEFFAKIVFKDTGTGNPIKGIPVWFGTTSDSKVYYSDDNGEVNAEQESNFVDYNYAYVYTYSSGKKDNKIFTYLNYEFPAEGITKWISYSLTATDNVLDGYISGIDSSVNSSIYAYALKNNRSYYSPDYDSSSSEDGLLNYDIAMPDDPEAVFAFQRPEYDNCCDIPLSYGYNMDATNDSADVVLSNSFDSTAKFNLSNIDPNSYGTNNSMRFIIYDTDGATKYSPTFYNGYYDLTSDPTLANQIPIPTLSPDLGYSNVRAVYEGYSFDENEGVTLYSWQELQYLFLDADTTIHADLPSVHKVGSYQELSASTLPGFMMDIFHDEDYQGTHDYNALYYRESYKKPDGKYQYQTWFSSGYGTSAKTVKFSNIPAELTSYWNENPEDGSTMSYRYAESYAGYEYSTPVPYNMTTTLQLHVSDEGLSLSSKASKPSFKRPFELDIDIRSELNQQKMSKIDSLYKN